MIEIYLNFNFFQEVFHVKTNQVGMVQNKKVRQKNTNEIVFNFLIDTSVLVVFVNFGSVVEKKIDILVNYTGIVKV